MVDSSYPRAKWTPHLGPSKRFGFRFVSFRQQQRLSTIARIRATNRAVQLAAFPIEWTHYFRLFLVLNHKAILLGAWRPAWDY
jgi:hypothetical protein